MSHLVIVLLVHIIADEAYVRWSSTRILDRHRIGMYGERMNNPLTVWEVISDLCFVSKIGYVVAEILKVLSLSLRIVAWYVIGTSAALSMLHKLLNQMSITYGGYP